MAGERPRGRSQQRWSDTIHACMKVNGVHSDQKVGRVKWHHGHRKTDTATKRADAQEEAEEGGRKLRKPLEYNPLQTGNKEPGHTSGFRERYGRRRTKGKRAGKRRYT